MNRRKGLYECLTQIVNTADFSLRLPLYKAKKDKELSIRVNKIMDLVESELELERNKYEGLDRTYQSIKAIHLSEDYLFEYGVILDLLPIGVVILDEMTNIVFANTLMYNAFKLGDNRGAGGRFGNLFKCSKLKENDICGVTVSCDFCDVRSSVNEVLEKNTVLEGVHLVHEFMIGNKSSVKEHLVNAYPVSKKGRKYVLLTFQEKV